MRVLHKKHFKKFVIELLTTCEKTSKRECLTECGWCGQRLVPSRYLRVLGKRRLDTRLSWNNSPRAPLGPGPRFSKDPETFRARRAIFSSSVSKNGEVYTPETSCMKGTSIHIKSMWIKQLCNRKVRDLTMALRARKVSGTFEKRAPDRFRFKTIQSDP